MPKQIWCTFLCAAIIWSAAAVKLIPQAEAKTAAIKIGATVSLSGKYVEPSLKVQNAYRLWAKQINANDRLLGRPVELILYDDKSQARRCVQLYKKLIARDKVDLVLAPYGTPLTYKASEITEANGYVMIACTASGPQIWERGFKKIFGVYATADRYFIGYLDVIARRGFKTVGIIFGNNAFTRSAAEGARRWAKLFGLEVVFYKCFDDNFTKLEKLTSRAVEIKPDGMLFCLYPPSGYAILKYLSKNKRRFNSMAFTIVPVFPNFYTRAGEIAEGVFGPSHWEPDPRLPFPGSQKFIKDFQQYTGTLPTYHSASAYTACQILTKAIGHIGSLNQDKIAVYIQARDTMTIMGRFKVDHHGRQVGHNPLLIQWQKGRKEIVYPTKLRTAEPVFQQPQESGSQ